MYFESYNSLLYSDTLLPDIFLTEYMPSMDSDYFKVYAYCLFLSKHNKQATVEELSKILCIDTGRVKDAFVYFESVGIASRKENSITLSDLKEKEIKKIYRMKSTSTPDEAVQSSERNLRRSRTITSINNTYFQGVMAPSWYTDIDAWFDRYKFDEDVMCMLFSHCKQYKGLSKSYIVKVADNWYNRNIKTCMDLEKYLEEYEKFKDVSVRVVKKLNLSRNLTEYEEEYLEKWVTDYKYPFEIIELALKKTTAKTNPNFKYIHAILTDWYDKGFKTRDEITAYEKTTRQSSYKSTAKESPIPQRGNFDQRNYDDEFYNSLYKNARKSKTV